jgi:FkbM family methyltransferase
MIARLKSHLSAILGRTPLALLPVRVRGGIAKGARWTLLPYSAYWRGHGERDVEAAIHQLGNLDGACCWDLGAHFGIYTIGLALAVGPGGQVAAFEPDPRSHARCAHHVRMNKLANVALFNAAVGERASRDKLIIGGGLGATGNHLRYEDEPVKRGEHTIDIVTLQLDELVANKQIRPPRFVKVDVEGHGGKALAGARQTLAEHRPVLVMSFHSEFELDAARAVLSPIGYACFDPAGGALPWPEALYRTAVLRC